MKLLGEPGTLVAQEPAVARMLNLALACGGAAGALNVVGMALLLSLIHISEPTRLSLVSRMPSSA